MIISIPGFKELDIRNILLDFNGTIAVNGKISLSVKKYINLLANEYKIYILTADTYRTASHECIDLPVELLKYTNENVAQKKLTMLQNLGSEHCAAIGNGRNDIDMLKAASLSISVMETEGMYAPLFSYADICTKSIEDALSLLLEKNKLIADLRG